MNRVTQYALDVSNGDIIAGRYVRLACQRHIDDLKSSESILYIYRFDEDKANDIIDFSESLTIAEGDEELPLILEPFQLLYLVLLMVGLQRIKAIEDLEAPIYR